MNPGFRPRRRSFLKLKSVLRVVVVVFIAFFSLLRLFAIYPNVSASVDQRPQPTIGKVMMIYGNNTVYERAIATHKEHCRRLGYPLFLLRRQVLDGVWNKLAYLVSLIVQELEKPVDERLEWLFWVDSDTVLMNPNMRIETFLPPPHLTDVHMLLTEDWNGMNAGVFPIRVHPWSIELLSAAIGYPFTSPGKELYWAEQSALARLFKEHEYYARSVVYVPLRWFNAYMRAPDGVGLNEDSPEELQVHPGDLLVHFPGTPKEHFNATLSPYLDIAEAHRADWELPAEETVYPVETLEFWRRYSAKHGIEYPDITADM